MTTIPTPFLAHQPVMPLPIPSYVYRFPNSDSIPYSALPERTGVYNKTLPGTYQWENHNPDRNGNLTYLGPDYFKTPPKHYAKAPNYPKENYGPTQFSRIDSGPGRHLRTKGYLPHFTNKTHSEWYKFLDATPERFLTSDYQPNRILNIPRSSSTANLRRGTLDSCETANSGIGADFAQRPQMALNSQFRSNDGLQYSTLFNSAPWKPYGNSPAYFKTYISGYPTM